MDFQEFPKIARLSREVIVTEKIDGTNSQIFIEGNCIYCGSRNRWITPENDNFGFARWVRDHEQELFDGLGPGRHFGEWWGSGIQRGYGLPKGEKRFSLFNTVRWCLSGQEPKIISTDEKGNVKMQSIIPACCSLVPVLWTGIFSTTAINLALADLEHNGSRAVPGFMNPEGIVVYHIAGNVAFKKTLGNDGHKGGNGK